MVSWVIMMIQKINLGKSGWSRMSPLSPSSAILFFTACQKNLFSFLQQHKKIKDLFKVPCKKEVDVL